MAGTGSSGLYQDEGAPAISDINVTPLVDVMLVLLIIFIATAPLIANRGIKAALPSTDSGEQIPGKLKVTLDENGALFIDTTKYEDREAAVAELTRRSAGDPEIQAIIVADKTIPYGDIMDVIDLVKKGKITKFALASNPKQRDDGDE